MGTQQILMVIISIFIVGAAIAFGFQMMDIQATNSQRQQVASDLQGFGGKVLEYMKTPDSIGGGKDQAANIEKLASFLGFTQSGGDYTLQNYDGIFTLESFTTGTESKVRISAINAENTIRLLLVVDLNQTSGKAVVVTHNPS